MKLCCYLLIFKIIFLFSKQLNYVSCINLREMRKKGELYTQENNIRNKNNSWIEFRKAKIEKQFFEICRPENRKKLWYKLDNCKNEKKINCFNSFMNCGYCPDYIESNIVRDCKEPGTFALTFDDGPRFNLTMALLDLLKEKKVNATFFLVARNLYSMPNVNAAKRALKEGHQIASHSFDHSDIVKTFKKSKCLGLREKIKNADKIFIEKLGISPKFFRPPYGEINEEVLYLLKNLGYNVALWNYDTGDWSKHSHMENLDIVKEYKELLQPLPKQCTVNSLQHDTNHLISGFVERYSIIIDMVKEAGFKFVTMSECMGEGDNQPYFPKKNKIKRLLNFNKKFTSQTRNRPIYWNYLTTNEKISIKNFLRFLNN